MIQTETLFIHRTQLHCALYIGAATTIITLFVLSCLQMRGHLADFHPNDNINKLISISISLGIATIVTLAATILFCRSNVNNATAPPPAY